MQISRGNMIFLKIDPHFGFIFIGSDENGFLVWYRNFGDFMKTRDL